MAPNGNDAGAGAFPRHEREFPVEVDVGQLEPAQLGNADAGVQQQPEDDFVSAAERDRPVECAGSAAGDRAVLEHRGDLDIGQDRHRLLRRRRDLDAIGRGNVEFALDDQPAAEAAHPAQPGGDGGGLRRLGEISQPRGDGVPGQLLKYRFPAAFGEPLREEPDALAVEHDGLRRLRGGAQVAPEGREQVVQTYRHGRRSSGE